MQLTGTFSREDNKTATIYAFCAFCSFSAQSIILREVSDDVSATAIVGLRSAIAFLVLVPLFVVDRHSLIPRRGLGLLFLRALFTGLGMTTATIAITRITLTSFTLFQMSEVFFTMTLATLFLKERIRARQWWGIIIGSFGVLLVLRPGAIAFSWWDLLALSSAFFLALSACLFRLGRQAYSIAAVLFWQNLGICVIFLPAGIVSWHAPSAVDAGLLAMLSLMQAAAQVLYARAMMTGAFLHRAVALYPACDRSDPGLPDLSRAAFIDRNRRRARHLPWNLVDHRTGTTMAAGKPAALICAPRFP